MKKFIFIFFIVFPALIYSGFTPRVNIGGNLSIWDPPGNTQFAPLFETWIEYYFSNLVSVRGTGAYSTWSEDSITYQHRRATVDGIFRPPLIPMIDFGLGGGLGFYQTATSIEGDNDEGTLGIQGLGEISYKPMSGFSLDLIVKGIVPNINESSEITWQIGGGITGELSF